MGEQLALGLLEVLEPDLAVLELLMQGGQAGQDLVLWERDDDAGFTDVVLGDLWPGESLRPLQGLALLPLLFPVTLGAPGAARHY